MGANTEGVGAAVRWMRAHFPGAEFDPEAIVEVALAYPRQTAGLLAYAERVRATQNSAAMFKEAHFKGMTGTVKWATTESLYAVLVHATMELPEGFPAPDPSLHAWQQATEPMCPLFDDLAPFLGMEVMDSGWVWNQTAYMRTWTFVKPERGQATGPFPTENEAESQSGFSLTSVVEASDGWWSVSRLDQRGPDGLIGLARTVRDHHNGEAAVPLTQEIG